MTADPRTIQDARRLVNAAEAADEDARKLRRRRDNAIRQLHEQGMTTRAIAEAVGLSHQRIFQLLDK